MSLRRNLEQETKNASSNNLNVFQNKEMVINVSIESLATVSTFQVLSQQTRRTVISKEFGNALVLVLQFPIFEPVDEHCFLADCRLSFRGNTFHDKKKSFHTTVDELDNDVNELDNDVNELDKDVN
ncbi:hypothetical protein BgiBS90_033664 [Biomphalaria glabrata]|nr:hypothetical protein BgiBS90_033664 [Biomphalaria glabrata]